MRILFVLSGNYPCSSTGTNLLNKILFEGNLLNRFEEIAVLGGKDTYWDSDEEKYSGINVYKVYSWTVLPKEDLYKVLKENPCEFIRGMTEKVRFHFNKKFNKKNFIDKYASKAFYHALKKMNAQKYDAIVSISGRYYQTDAVATFCKETKTRFFFYQVDPCGSNESFSSESIKVRQKFEQFLYEIAEVVFTTDLIAEDVKEYLAEELRKKIIIMEFPLISQPIKHYIQRKKRQKVVCLFTGSIYGGIRNPDYTIKLFRPFIKSGDVEVHFVGVTKFELNDNEDIICHGILPLQDTRKIVDTADILINIGNSVLNQVPSKIFDYISTGKPIINICKSRNCPTLKYLNKYPYALNLFEEEELLFEQQKELLKFVKHSFDKEVSFDVINELYQECTPKYCASIMGDIICKEVRG